VEVIIIQALKIIIISVKEALELDSFFVFAATKATRSRGAQVYIIGLFKKLKITLRHQFFSVRCAAFWNGLDDITLSQRALSQHSVDASIATRLYRPGVEVSS